MNPFVSELVVTVVAAIVLAVLVILITLAVQRRSWSLGLLALFPGLLLVAMALAALAPGTSRTRMISVSTSWEEGHAGHPDRPVAPRSLEVRTHGEVMADVQAKIDQAMAQSREAMLKEGIEGFNDIRDRIVVPPSLPFHVDDIQSSFVGPVMEAANEVRTSVERSRGPSDRSARPPFFRRIGRTIVGSDIVIALAVAAFLFISYLFLDAGTRGHFTWRLRLLSVLGFAGLCFAVIMLRGGP